MRFVVAGTGRSGTKWCATALRTGGVLCGHEQVFRVSDWTDWGYFQGDSSLGVVPWLPDLDVLRILVVRHPLDVADSFRRVGSILAGSLPADLDAYLRETHPEVFTQPHELAAGVAYWLAWNEAAIPHTEKVARLETLTVESLFELIEIEPRWPVYSLGPLNSGPPSVRPDWSEIPRDLALRADDLATSFGYE